MCLLSDMPTRLQRTDLEWRARCLLSHFAVSKRHVYTHHAAFGVWVITSRGCWAERAHMARVLPRAGITQSGVTSPALARKRSRPSTRPDSTRHACDFSKEYFLQIHKPLWRSHKNHQNHLEASWGISALLWGLCLNRKTRRWNAESHANCYTTARCEPS